MKRTKAILIALSALSVVGTLWLIENVHFIILNRMVQKDWRLLLDGYGDSRVYVSTYGEHPDSEFVLSFTSIYSKADKEFIYGSWHAGRDANTIEELIQELAEERSQSVSNFQVYREFDGQRPKPNEAWTGEISIHLPPDASPANFFLGRRAFDVVVIDGKVVRTRAWRTDW